MPASSSRPLFIGLGELLWDMLPRGRKLGGAPANFAYHANALGAHARIVSCVGGDQAGTDILAQAARLGLSTDFIGVDPAHPTGTVDVTLDAAGTPAYLIHEHVAWDFIAWTKEMKALAAAATAACFGSLCQRSPVSRRTIRAFLDATRPECLRVFDVNLRQEYFSREIIVESLKRSSVLKINDEELPVVARLLGLPAGEEAAGRQLMRDFPLRVVALTRGAHGSSLFSADDASHLPAWHVAVKDTVGAGDAFTAALVAGLTRGLPLQEINAAASRVAAFVCTQEGATPPYPAELRSLLR